MRRANEFARESWCVTEVGALATATGYASGPSGLTVVGVARLAVGVVLLILKIARRNEAGS
jgi:hypothetical protein